MKNFKNILLAVVGLFILVVYFQQAKQAKNLEEVLVRSGHWQLMVDGCHNQKISSCKVRAYQGPFSEFSYAKLHKTKDLSHFLFTYVFDYKKHKEILLKDLQKNGAAQSQFTVVLENVNKGVVQFQSKNNNNKTTSLSGWTLNKDNQAFYSFPVGPHSSLTIKYVQPSVYVNQYQPLALPYFTPDKQVNILDKLKMKANFNNKLFDVSLFLISLSLFIFFVYQRQHSRSALLMLPAIFNALAMISGEFLDSSISVVSWFYYGWSVGFFLLVLAVPFVTYVQVTPVLRHYKVIAALVTLSLSFFLIQPTNANASAQNFKLILSKNFIYVEYSIALAFLVIFTLNLKEYWRDFVNIPNKGVCMVTNFHSSVFFMTIFAISILYLMVADQTVSLVESGDSYPYNTVARNVFNFALVLPAVHLFFMRNWIDKTTLEHFEKIDHGRFVYNASQDRKTSVSSNALAATKILNYILAKQRTVDIEYWYPDVNSTSESIKKTYTPTERYMQNDHKPKPDKANDAQNHVTYEADGDSHTFRLKVGNSGEYGWRLVNPRMSNVIDDRQYFSKFLGYFIDVKSTHHAILHSQTESTMIPGYILPKLGVSSIYDIEKTTTVEEDGYVFNVDIKDYSLWETEYVDVFSELMNKTDQVIMNNFMDPNRKDGKGKFFDKYMGDGHQSITQIGVDPHALVKKYLDDHNELVNEFGIHRIRIGFALGQIIYEVQVSESGGKIAYKPLTKSGAFTHAARFESLAKLFGIWVIFHDNKVDPNHYYLGNLQVKGLAKYVKMHSYLLDHQDVDPEEFNAHVTALFESREKSAIFRARGYFKNLVGKLKFADLYLQFSHEILQDDALIASTRYLFIDKNDVCYQQIIKNSILSILDQPKTTDCAS